MPWSIAYNELIAAVRLKVLEDIKLKVKTIPNEEEFDKLRDMVTEMQFETYSIASLIDLKAWKKDIFDLIDSGIDEIKQKRLIKRLLEEMIRKG